METAFGFRPVNKPTAGFPPKASITSEVVQSSFMPPLFPRNLERQDPKSLLSQIFWKLAKISAWQTRAQTLPRLSPSDSAYCAGLYLATIRARLQLDSALSQSDGITLNAQCPSRRRLRS